MKLKIPAFLCRDFMHINDVVLLIILILTLTKYFPSLIKFIYKTHSFAFNVLGLSNMIP